MSAQDLKFVRLLSQTAAASLGVSFGVGTLVVAAAAIMERLF